MKLGVFGCGNMGGAIIRGLIDKGTLRKEQVLLNDKDPRKAQVLSRETGAEAMSIREITDKSDVLLLAVKPQDAGGLLEEIRSYLSGQTIVSVMAGVTAGSITEKIGKEVPVARAMPNMAAFIKRSVTGISFNDKVQDKNAIMTIFESVGTVVEVNEDEMDAVTALSGSGPAYLFYLAEAMESAGKNMGMNAETVKKLVTETLTGAGELLAVSGADPQVMIDKVASKGGTTEAALKVFSDRGIRDAVKEAVLKAKERSEELSGGK
ncbi:MAG: pyrroline-5-carboxylate reductase [Candidatus Omnitrophota bacterium]